MSAKELKTQLEWCAAALMGFVWEIVFNYVAGRTNRWPGLFLLLPYLLVLAGSVGLLICLVRSFISRRHVAATALMFFLVLCLFPCLFKIDTSYIYLRGFQAYARKVLTPDEWRGIARFAQANIHAQPGEEQFGRQLPGPGKDSLWNENKHRALWSKLTVETHVQKLSDSLVIYVDSESTSITWGGALAGHWGIRIYSGTNNAKYSGSPSGYFRQLPIAGDIDAFISSD